MNIFKSRMSVASLDGDSSQRVDRIADDELFDVLANRRRRYTLHALKQLDGPTELGPLAEQIAAWENDVSVREITGAQRKRVYTALQQSHLPKMDDAGIVEFDKNRGVVDPEPIVDDIDIYIDVVRGNEIPWSVYYLGLAGVFTALTLAVWVEAWPFSLIPMISWMAFMTVALATSAGAHVYHAKANQLGRQDEPAEARRIREAKTARSDSEPAAGTDAIGAEMDATDSDDGEPILAEK